MSNKKIILNTFDDLIEFIYENDLNVKDLNKIIHPIFNAFFINEHPKEKVIEILQDYIPKFKAGIEQRIFLDIDPLNIE
jgi:hypothetical protein